MENRSLEIVSAGKLLHVKASGKLTKESYETFAPLVDELIAEHGKLKILFEMHDFHGWTAGALWEDIKFDFKHWRHIERLAIVGGVQMGRGHGGILQALHNGEGPILRANTARRGAQLVGRSLTRGRASTCSRESDLQLSGFLLSGYSGTRVAGHGSLAGKRAEATLITNGRRHLSRALKMIYRKRSPGPGQESVWDYPRPPRLDTCSSRILVTAHGVTIADSTCTLRVLETSHPPVYYIPPGDIALELLADCAGQTFCEWKGVAGYCDIVVRGHRIEQAGWYYTHPTSPYESLADHVAFYPNKAACFVDGERVQSQAGGFYGGWITSGIVGPFKGAPGTSGW